MVDSIFSLLVGDAAGFLMLMYLIEVDLVYLCQFCFFSVNIFSVCLFLVSGCRILF